MPHQFLQLVGIEPHRFRTVLQHHHGLAHLRGAVIDLADRLAAVEAALVELLNDGEHAFHRLVQLHVFRGGIFGQAQAVIDVLDALLHEADGFLRFVLQAFDHVPNVIGRT
ncbi:hypothetical protein D9M71_536550 [compost metagenome]